MTGHDTRRDQIVEALAGLSPVHGVLVDGTVEIVAEDIADMVMPILDAAVAEARTETAEAIAQAMEAEAEKHPPGLGSYRAWWRRVARMVRDIARQHAGRCCDLHNRNCEPTSELCCWWCTEATHPNHPPGEQCIAPDLSGSGQP